MTSPVLSALAQSVLTSALLNSESNFIIASKLSSLELPYRRARVVAHEISNLGLAVVDWGVKGYRVELDEPLIAWSLTRAHLASPVVDIVRVPSRPVVPAAARLAGHSAAAITNGTPAPCLRRLAIFQEDATSVLECRGNPVQAIAAFDEVELWRIPTAALAGRNCHVDPISLFLSLRGFNDQAALSSAERAVLNLWDA